MWSVVGWRNGKAGEGILKKNDQSHLETRATEGGQRIDLDEDQEFLKMCFLLDDH